MNEKTELLVSTLTCVYYKAKKERRNRRRWREKSRISSSREELTVYEGTVTVGGVRGSFFSLVSNFFWTPVEQSTVSHFSDRHRQKRKNRNKSNRTGIPLAVIHIIANLLNTTSALKDHGDKNHNFFVLYKYLELVCIHNQSRVQRIHSLLFWGTINKDNSHALYITSEQSNLTAWSHQN